MYWRGNKKAQKSVVDALVGSRRSSLGTKVLQTYGLVIAMLFSKAAGNYVRLAEVEEELPWHELYDCLRDTDEQTYL